MAAVASKSFDWAEISPGRFSRPLDSAETMLASFADASKPLGLWGTQLFGVSKYNTANSDIVSVFKRAWKELRLEHPQMATEITDEKTRVFDLNSEAEWSEKTFVVIEDQSVEHLFRNLPYSGRAWLYVFPTQSLVICRGPHELTDARGQFHFFNLFYERVGQIISGEASSTQSELTPPASPPSAKTILSRIAPAGDACALPEITAETMQAAGEGLGRSMTTPGGIGGHDLDKIPPGNPSYRTIQFTLKETQQVISAIKAKGLTVSPVIHAAIVSAQNEFRGKLDPYCSFTPVDTRQYYGEAGHAPLTTYLGGVITDLAPGEFQDNVKELVKHYATIRPSWESGGLSAASALVTQASSQPQKEPQKQPPPQMPHCCVSQPGNADVYMKSIYPSSFSSPSQETKEQKEQKEEDAHRSIQVTDLSIGCVEFYSLLFLVFLTFRGRFTGRLSYNDRYHSPDEIERFAKLFKGILLKGLDVDQETDGMEMFFA